MLKIYLYGPVRACWEGANIDLTVPEQRLLAYLVLRTGKMSLAEILASPKLKAPVIAVDINQSDAEDPGSNVRKIRKASATLSCKDVDERHYKWESVRIDACSNC